MWGCNNIFNELIDVRKKNKRTLSKSFFLLALPRGIIPIFFTNLIIMYRNNFLMNCVLNIECF